MKKVLFAALLVVPMLTACSTPAEEVTPVADENVATPIEVADENTAVEAEEVVPAEEVVEEEVVEETE